MMIFFVFIPLPRIVQMYEIHIVMEVRTLCLNLANRKISQSETSVT